jgi:trigger factor
MAAGEEKTFALKFPDDYHGKDVAGKEANFRIAVKSVEEPRLPEVDAQFAQSLGVADGDVTKMKAEIRANVEREAAKRIDARVKAQALQALLDATPLELPKSLVEMETQSLMQRAAADLQARHQARADAVPARGVRGAGEAARRARADHRRAGASARPAAEAGRGARAGRAGSGDL